MTYKNIIAIAAISGMIAVIMGAFGAHALKEVLTETQLSSYKTGNNYQFYHTLLLIVIGILYKFGPSKLLKNAAWACIIGILFFSGSLYLLSCRELLGIESTKILGPITPIGGLFFTVSWLLLAWNYIIKRK